MAKIAHLTSVHPPYDIRIFYKECKTLAQAGYKVVLIVPHDRNEVVDGVKIRAVPKSKGRLARMTRTVWQVYRAALAENAEIYHFHDPELIPAGLLLKMQGKKVIYDVHEDNVGFIRDKEYLPKWFRPILAILFDKFETVAAKAFEVVLAERYYLDRFPHGITVLNYPKREIFKVSSTTINTRSKRPRLLFAGLVSKARGALLHANLVNVLEDIEVHMVGFCGKDIADKMRQVAGNSKRLYIEGEGFLVPYDRILSYYAQGNWTAGLSIFLPTPNNVKKEATKFFEYMGFGIPIICSDFPVWRALIEETGSGLCVDPLDPRSIADAIQYLVDHPKEAEEMGQNGRRAVSERFNWNGEAQKLLALYERLI
ncbi:MAG: glycosyltransferase [Desulfobacteraceae bacterium]|nr:glycosyltransferase [Desulfobacteraceae bacterium]